MRPLDAILLNSIALACPGVESRMNLDPFERGVV